ncbi:MAG: peptidase C45 [Acidobacteriia bacterium]|nr:peptidase C45 [Terriglobia bacterium]
MSLDPRLPASKRPLFVGLCVLLLFFLSACSRPAPKPEPKTTVSAPTSDQMMAKASRRDENGWIHVHLEGAPDVVGYQHGYLLANEILDLRGALSMVLDHDTKKNWDFYRTESLKLFWSKTPEEYQKEIDGIVRGANAKLGANKIDREDVVAMNAMEEMAFYYVPWLKSKTDPKAAENKAPGNCSAFVATGSWTKDGQIVMAHNNWTSYVTGERWNVIMDLVPEKGHRVLMDAMPGFIHSGDDFNVNDAGIMVTETTITQFQGFDPNGIAEFVRARKAIQYAASIDDWVATMREGNNGGYANDWLIGDNKTGEIARLELGLKNTPLERTQDGYFVGSNFPVDPKVIKEETTFNTKAKNTSPNARRVCWESLMKQYKGRIDVESAKKFEANHLDTFRNKEEADANTLCGHVDRDARGTPEWEWGKFYPGGTVQSKAIDGTLAGEMKFWAAMGHPCGQNFVAKDFLKAHPEYQWQEKYLRDMPGQPWTLFGKRE